MGLVVRMACGMVLGWREAGGVDGCVCSTLFMVVGWTVYIYHYEVSMSMA